MAKFDMDTEFVRKLAQILHGHGEREFLGHQCIR